MAHEHHAHDEHGHDPDRFGAMFALAAALNIALVVVQIVYGLLAHSVALLADAGHNFGDVLGLIIAWTAHVLAQRIPGGRYTYGFRSASILAALVNGVILLVATGAIAWEAIRRLSEPGEVAGGTMILVAGVGIVINGISAWLLMGGHRHDLNIRAAVLHMIGDAAVSAAVVVAGGLIMLTGRTWLDPAVSLAIAAVIVWGTWGVVGESARLSLDAVPPGVDLDKVADYLKALPGVEEVHDLHIWAMSTTETALTCHLVMPNGHPGDAFLDSVAQHLQHDFAIAHPTLQIELSDAGACKLAPAHVV